MLPYLMRPKDFGFMRCLVCGVSGQCRETMSLVANGADRLAGLTPSPQRPVIDRSVIESQNRMFKAIARLAISNPIRPVPTMPSAAPR
jgi:hypothetical protein